MDVYLAGRSELSADLGLDEMNPDMIPNTATCLYGLRPSVGKSRKVGLAKWLRRSMIAAKTKPVWGSYSLFKVLTVSDSFWKVLVLLYTIIGFKIRPLATGIWK